MKIAQKIISIVLMVVAPIITFKAFYEYALVVFMHHKPSYPFGKEFMNSLRHTDISYLTNYEKELMTIGLVFLGITILSYVSMMIKALMNLIWVAFIGAVLYFVFHVVK